ncbi:phosphate acetyltransferase [Thiotrichales bacterium 19S3-7]|nr:phosphate acetyltransferase [Thiotrichales bacterium 19S3-7]MCF6802070.1 phosphate acetyltransferase [Thiotrichales bacterium 19S3-11]
MILPIVLLPSSHNTGLSSLQLGLGFSLEQKGYSVKTFNPLTDSDLSAKQMEQYLINDDLTSLLEYLLDYIDGFTKNCDILIIKGCIIKPSLKAEFGWFTQYKNQFNQALIKALNAYVILVTTPSNKSLIELEHELQLASKNIESENLIGAIITKLNAPIDNSGNISFSLLDEAAPKLKYNLSKDDIKKLPIFMESKLKLLGITPWKNALTHPRLIDIKNFLSLDVLNEGDLSQRRIKTITMCSRTINRVIDELNPGTLIITSADRSDILIAATLANQKGIRIGGILLTATNNLDKKVFKFCLSHAKENNLPVLTTINKSISTILKLTNLDYSEIPTDDDERIQLLKTTISEEVSIEEIENRLATRIVKKMSPAAFRYYLIQRARSNLRSIVLPEGSEPRTIQAAIYCTQRKIAHCILLGKKKDILSAAQSHGITLTDTISIVEPDTIKDQFIQPLIALRKHKGMTESVAKDALENPITLGTMMVQQGLAHGLVSGAIHTTADTIRPALKLIKTKKDFHIVSSVFFMCTSDKVLVYGDCAINPNPTAEELAEIAIQSSQSAISFGIEPKIAMISYSTGSSGAGRDVEKVRKATELIKQQKPDLVIDGPMQYDAAIDPKTAQTKAPNSPVAGSANVIIFPDLNTGNTTYKAVQRSANILSIGPILQGLNKPVNDLSRGATVDDIIYTIAITAIQD